MIARFLSLALLIIFSIPSWGLVATQQYESYQYDGSYITESTKNYNYGIVKKLLSERAQKTLESLSETPLDRPFFALLGDFVATKSVKSSLSTLHTRGTKIPGGRKIEDTLAGSNKIKNSNGDIFKRVDFAPSKPHNGLSPHTHPNFRNQLPDGAIRSGVSRNAGSVTRRDIIDAARQGGQRTGGL